MNIAISGVPGSGKSTIAKMLGLKDRLLTGGVMFREYAAEHGLTLEELNSRNTDEIDTIIDDKIKDITLQHNDRVVESRYSAKFTQNAYKVFLYCNPRVAAKRIYQDTRSTEKYSNATDCFNKMIARMQIERERGIRKYEFDSFDMRNYDLVLDTTYLTPREIANFINGRHRGVLLAPDNCLPTEPFDFNKDYVGADFEVVYYNYLWYVIGDHNLWWRMLMQRHKTYVCTLSDDNSKPQMADIKAYENAAGTINGVYPIDINYILGGL